MEKVVTMKGNKPEKGIVVIDVTKNDAQKVEEGQISANYVR